MSLTVYQYWE